MNQVDFTVPDGQITVLVGSNGSGKSTLLKTLACLLIPTNGQVLLDGQFIHKSRIRDVVQKLGLLPQGLLPPKGGLSRISGSRPFSSSEFVAAMVVRRRACRV